MSNIEEKAIKLAIDLNRIDKINSVDRLLELRNFVEEHYNDVDFKDVVNYETHIYRRIYELILK